ncbi:MAG: hypothetical protein AAF518_19060 [Spirochaetota bacterium]
MATSEQQNLVTGFFAKFLQDNREQLNQKFLLARQQYPQLESETFYQHLRTFIYPLANASAKNSPSKALEFAEKGYSLILYLLGKEFIGNNCKSFQVKKAWEQIFELGKPYIEREPYAICKALSNAILNLHFQYQKPLQAWLELLAAYPKNRTWQGFLNFGLVSSWRCGLAHYRESAENILQQLDKEELAILFSLSPSKLEKESFLQAVLEKPWLSPTKICQGRSNYNSLAIQTVGGFSGYGQEFSIPPQISLVEGHIIITSGANDYRLFADRYGTMLVKTDINSILQEDTNLVENTVEHYRIDKEGEITYKNLKKRFPELVSYQNAIEYQETLLITHPNSYFVYLIHPS